MVYAKPLIPVLLVLFLVAVATARSSGGSVPTRVASLARLGFAMAKLSLLLLPLEVEHLHLQPLP